MKYIKIYILLLVILVIGCSNKNIEIKEEKIPKNYGLEISKVEKINLSSEILNKNMNINIYLPKGYGDKKKYSVLYILHGYGTNEDTWIPDLMLNERADELIKSDIIEPLIIVAPQIDNSFGINSSDEPRVIGEPPYDSVNEGRYSDYILNEVIPYIDSKYSTISSREGRYIGGLSMGGFAALHIAFNSNMFSKVGGHSPALYLDDQGDIVKWLYPDDITRKKRDPIYIAQECNLMDLRVYLDCGDNDLFEFYKGCSELDNVLKSKGINTQYHLNPGEHEGIYWATNAKKYLQFYSGKDNY